MLIDVISVFSETAAITQFPGVIFLCCVFHELKGTLSLIGHYKTKQIFNAIIFLKQTDNNTTLTNDEIEQIGQVSLWFLEKLICHISYSFFFSFFQLCLILI